MIFQGPTLFLPSFNPSRVTRNLVLEVEDGEIHAAISVAPARVDGWVQANVHVQGRPDWVFVKIHTHGASLMEDANEILGPGMDTALTYLETAYNDGSRYVLHYITAREAFNLARAAVDGKTGDPRQFYDYLIPKYAP